jgi:hypothetical protein
LLNSISSPLLSYIYFIKVKKVLGVFFYSARFLNYSVIIFNYVDRMNKKTATKWQFIDSPYGIRTRVTAVKRRCLNPLTNGPFLQHILLYRINFSCQYFFKKKKEKIPSFD